MCLVNNNDTDRAIVLLTNVSVKADTPDLMTMDLSPHALRGLRGSLPESAAIREVTLGRTC